MHRIRVLMIMSFILLAATSTVFSQEGSPSPGGAVGDHTGYTLFTPMRSNQVYLVDSQGRIVHAWTVSAIGTEAVLRENGNLIVATGQTETEVKPFAVKAGLIPQLTGRLEEYTWDGELIWAYEFDRPDFQLHHAIDVMPNCSILFIAWNHRTGEEAIAAGRDPNLLGEEGLWPDSILEYNPEQNDIVWEWNMWDHLIQDFDPTKDNYGVVADHPELIDVNYFFARKDLIEDWLHTNAISYNPQLDQIAISARDFHEVWIIDHSISTEEARGEAGDLLYRWGNPAAYDRGVFDDYQISYQHDVRWVPEGYPGAGHITLYSNRHLDDPDATAEEIIANADYSKAVEFTLPLLPDGTYALDEGQPYGPAEPTWVYGDDQPEEHFFSGSLSGVLRLTNGNTLITEGVAGRLFEVTPADQIVWEYRPPFRQFAFLTPESPAEARQVFVFRAFRYEPDYPGLAGRDLSDGVWPADLATTDANYPALVSVGYGYEAMLSSEVPVRYYATEVTEEEVAANIFEVEVLSGNIDPVVTVTDAEGDVLAEDDNSGGERNALIEDFTPQEAGWLYITVNHAGDALTGIEGRFRFVRKIAGPFADVAPGIPRILYGTEIQDSITDDDPESLFAFYGEEGEQITVRMQRDNGSLDPVVELLNADREILITAVADTEVPVAVIEAYTLSESGVYYIRTTRYTGEERPSDTTGVYTMELRLEDAVQ